MLKLFRIARFGSQAPKPSTGHSHSHDSHGHDSHSHDSHSVHSHDHHGHELGDHGHVGHHQSHKKLPEGSWHRHSDDEDPYFYYDRYGPFHSYSFLAFPKPDHPEDTPESDVYRNEIQGYIRLAEVDDHRRHTQRAVSEYFIAALVLFAGLGLLTARTNYDDPNVEKKIGDALITAQEIEEFIERAKERRA